MSTNLGTLGHMGKEPRPNIVLVRPSYHPTGECKCKRPLCTGRLYLGWEACGLCGNLPRRRERTRP